MDRMLANSETSILFILILVPVVIFGIAWGFRRGSDLLELWANANNVRILQKEYCWFLKGPFFWSSSRNQSVYRITVEDSEGQIRTGWAKCGGWFMGLWTSQVEVRWDKQQKGFPVVMPADQTSVRKEAPGFPVIMPDDKEPRDSQ